MQQSNPRYLTPAKIPLLFVLCWVAYFSAYLGRLNYSAAMAEIIRAEGFSNSACGMVATGFFICYGAGQLISGGLGDRVSPKWMVFSGLAVSAAVNWGMGLAATPGTMLVLWCVNGLAQSATWPPILRIFAEYFPPAYRRQACVKIAFTYPAGALTAYGLCAALVYFSGWRSVFFTTTALMAVCALLWIIGTLWVERFRTETPADTDAPQQAGPAPVSAFHFPTYLAAALCFICLGLALQGILRDGVMNWVPAYLSENFGIGTAFSILSATVLPIVNLGGIYAANFLTAKLRRDELQSSLLLFLTAGAAVVLLTLAGSRSLALSVLLFALVTSAMTGANMLLVSFIPTYFARYGKVSTMSGLLNASVYVGSSLAAYGIGAVVDHSGWGLLLFILAGTALLGAAACALGRPGWRRFVESTGAE